MRPEKCNNETASDVFCNVLGDTVDLCVKAHSRAFIPFLVCMYSQAAPHSTHPTNPLEIADQFETKVQNCSSEHLDDYPYGELKTCTHGQAGSALRIASLAASANYTKPTWVFVGDTYFPAPQGFPWNTSHAAWTNKIVAAVCDAYAGPKPASCDAQLEVVV